MNKQRTYNRRKFLKMGAGLATVPFIGGLLSACGGGNNNSTGLTKEEQFALTASQAVSAISTGRMTATEYVTTLLDRARSLSSLNAFITLNAAGALATAAKIDAMRQSNQTLPPLAGLPIVVKDNINTKDLPTTAGTPALRNFIPNANAPTLQTLLDAGAIIIGKGNMHELAFGITSTNFSPFAGPVKNPYNTALIPGGSSGGVASAISARIVPCGLGTDTGASCRLPAALTGIVGFRPSVGNGGAERRYSSNGVVPISHTRDTVGPMGRTVADVVLLDAVVTSSAAPVAADLKGLRFGVPKAFWNNLDNDLAVVMQSVKGKLAAAGVVFVDVDVPGLMELNAKVASPIALHEPVQDIPAYLKASGATTITLADIANQVASPDVKEIFQAVTADALGSAYPDAINIHRPALRALYENYFNQNNVDTIFFPTTPLPAVPIDLINGTSTVSINGGSQVDEFAAFTQNVDPGSNAGIPGLSIPAGLTPSGLPVGMEIDGRVGSDKKLLSIGLAIEALFGSLPAPKI